jgi:hypothetical protein
MSTHLPSIAPIVAEHQAAQDAARSAVLHAIRCGELLIEAKDSMPHGQFGAFCRQLPFAERTARAYMQLARLDDEKRQRVANMPMRDALQLIRSAEDAAALAEAAEKAAARGIKKDASFILPSAGHIDKFAEVVRDLKIPSERQADAARHVRDAELPQGQILPKLAVWWDVASGAALRRDADNERKRRMERLARVMGGGDLQAFLIKLDQRVMGLRRELQIADEFIQFASLNIRGNIAASWPEVASMLANIIEQAGSQAEPAGDVIDITPQEPLRIAGAA